MIAAPTPIQVTYFKRYRMEADLLVSLPPVILPDNYAWVPWDDSVLESHADVKQRCFKDELDGIVFPNLSNHLGCLRLMREIRSRPGFHAGSTWLIAHGSDHVATVQGVTDRTLGCIQNLGVVPGHRGKRLGVALLLQALHGFRGAGCKRATLEVTAQNETAVRLYRQLGFRFRKTLYRAVEPSIYQLTPVSESEWVV